MANIDNKSETAKREENILKFWQENNIFEKSLAKEAPKGEFVFYDGPPFATGLPHYGSLLSSIVKDVFPRYKTMRGFRVDRRWGWDCHGLPIENMIEKELGLKDKTEILSKVGIEKFNRTCRESVLRFASEWKKYVDRVGRWVEYDNAYKTMDNSFMESVWWALAELHRKGLLYEGRKVLLFCPHCQTPIAKAEVAMDNSYKDVTEEAVTVKFKIKNPEKLSISLNENEEVFLLAWTTTPWTLPGNVALAVGEDIEYVVVRDNLPVPTVKEPLNLNNLQNTSHKFIYLILAKDLYLKYKDMWLRYKILNNPKIEGKITGQKLVGLEYESLYDLEAVSSSGKKAYYVTSADFVTTDEGTGIVHEAPIYGEDDYELAIKKDLPLVAILDERGHFNEKVPKFIEGEYFKKAEKLIKVDLEERGLLFAKENNTHSYPHCHRCGTALLYNAITSWFLNVQKVKNKMIQLNKDVNWVPEHLKDGRFLNIMENAPDWTISRNRYWASPLPIWKCRGCSELKVVGSVSELKEQAKSSGNTLILVRHGESDSNVAGVINDNMSVPSNLTEVGKEQVLASAMKIKEDFSKVDYIFTSPFDRTKQTAEILAQNLDVDVSRIIIDERLKEASVGSFSGKSWDDFGRQFKSKEERFNHSLAGAENGNSVRTRVMEFVLELEEKYKDKKILVVSHGLPLFLMSVTLEGSTENDFFTKNDWQDSQFKTAGVKVKKLWSYPHNEKFELDLHRPYIDHLTFGCSCGGEMIRVPEVLDGWVESATMPFAQYHYPFENKEVFENSFPGDFVSEYIAQTRTWFYYMHTIATMLFGDKAFKNVVSTGTILAQDGSKMSKSKGNYTDPFINFDIYGADSLRYYLMNSVVMQSEDLKFSDLEIKDVHNRLINILWNTVKFYQMYVDDFNEEDTIKESDNVLDRWIISKLNQLKKEVTENLDKFDTVKASRPIKEFVTDFSTWYIRRSRDRFKSEDLTDRSQALGTTRLVLLELAKLLAPFMPFMAEDIFQVVKTNKNQESVHLEAWPEVGEIDNNILSEMKTIREIVSWALEARSKANIKVRQPLLLLKIKKDKPTSTQLEELVKDELNVKALEWGSLIETELELDTNLTQALKDEGLARDLIRAIQEMRKEKNLEPKDVIKLSIEVEERLQVIINNFATEIKSVVGAEQINFVTGLDNSVTIKIDDVDIKVAF